MAVTQVSCAPNATECTVYRLTTGATKITSSGGLFSLSCVPGFYLTFPTTYNTRFYTGYPYVAAVCEPCCGSLEQEFCQYRDFTDSPLAVTNGKRPWTWFTDEDKEDPAILNPNKVLLRLVSCVH